eukprot:11032188-Karenia_brevis.AAC.1
MQDMKDGGVVPMELIAESERAMTSLFQGLSKLAEEATAKAAATTRPTILQMLAGQVQEKRD